MDDSNEEEPVTVGQLLRERLAPQKSSARAIARIVGVHYQNLYDILADKKGISVALAVRFEEEFGIAAEEVLTAQTRRQLFYYKKEKALLAVGAQQGLEVPRGRQRRRPYRISPV